VWSLEGVALPRKLGLVAASILAVSVLTPAPAVLAAAGAARPSTASAGRCTTWVTTASRNVGSGDNQSNQLTAVRPLSAAGAWAAGWYTGGSTNRSLIEHWSRGRWRVVHSPNGSNSTNELTGVLATSATSAWAAGWDCNPAVHADRTLLLHWNGKTWKHAYSPNANAGSNDLNALGGTSAANIYAVGSYLTAAGGKVLILHWNGSHWRVMAGRNPNQDNSFSAVFALSPASISAVGSTSTSSTTRTLVEHRR
jgi:hypothetical protein